MPNATYNPSPDSTATRLLADKVIVITGASSGIGADAARVFAGEGANVVLGARSEGRLAELCDELNANGGASSYVVCDVSSATDIQRLVAAAVERHGRLDGAFNNAGISQGGGPGLSGYAATKHAVVGLTRAAAHDYGAHGLRINAVAPGTTDTPMMAAWKQRDHAIEDRLNAATPMGRGAQPTEIAEAAAWLLSDRASYVNGAVLVADGGLTA